MERKQIANVVVPAAAVAALIALVAVVIVAGGPEASKGKPGGPKAAADASAEGMSDTVPPTDAPDWRDIGDGLKVWDVKVGEGEAARHGAKVTIHYTGWLPNGTKFDSSLGDGPKSWPLGQLIQAWQIGIPGMKPGGIRRLLVPPELGYGKRGQPPDIPPDATLVFEVKLISSS